MGEFHPLIPYTAREDVGGLPSLVEVFSDLRIARGTSKQTFDSIAGVTVTMRYFRRLAQSSLLSIS